MPKSGRPKSASCEEIVSEVKQNMLQEMLGIHSHLTIKSKLHSKEYLECSKAFCQMGTSFAD